MSDLLAVESETVLPKKVIGKEDVDVAALIRRLGNSDWVRQGLPYLDKGAQCPFCQQQVDAELTTRLNAYFDEAYLKDLADITKTQEAYEVHAGSVLTRLEDILAVGSRHFDAVKLRADVDRLIARIGVNKRLIEGKRKEPSAPVVLEPLSDITDPILGQIAAANGSIGAHNSLLDNLATERSALVSEIWKCLLEENGPLLQKYSTDNLALNKAVVGLTSGIASKQVQLDTASAELRDLEKRVTSVQPTVNEINGLLGSFGFTGFKLKTAGERDHLYEIVRDDGGDAVATLSEGEKSFVSFLISIICFAAACLKAELARKESWFSMIQFPASIATFCSLLARSLSGYSKKPAMKRGRSSRYFS
jgi:wobble nucleotide-excising tRNase